MPSNNYIKPHHTLNFMNKLKQFLGNPVVLAVFVLVSSAYTLNFTASRFFADMKKDQDDMVASLRQAQTPEPQIAAISRAFDGTTSEVGSMAISFFSFTTVVLVACYLARRSGPPRHDMLAQAPQRELKHDHVV
jgi:hypothetical protein